MIFLDKIDVIRSNQDQGFNFKLSSNLTWYPRTAALSNIYWTFESIEEEIAHNDIRDFKFAENQTENKRTFNHLMKINSVYR